MKFLSNGLSSTLKSYRQISLKIWGEDSEPVKFLDDQIKNDPDGENAVVIADESQMIHTLKWLSWISGQ